jgi:TDG/mug DNA glycosylase family protein
MPTPWKPTPAQIAAAAGKSIRDVLAPGLRGIFVGINPGLYTAAIGCHFGRPGNRFWPALYAAGFTDRLLSPFDNRELLTIGWGITNLVNRATTTADQLTAAELVEGARRVERKVRRYRPRMVAFLGVTSYRTAFGRPKAVLGPQPERLADAAVWLLPNPSGLNAHYQAAALARLFTELREATEAMTGEEGRR